MQAARHGCALPLLEDVRGEDKASGARSRRDKLQFPGAGQGVVRALVGQGLVLPAEQCGELAGAEARVSVAVGPTEGREVDAAPDAPEANRARSYYKDVGGKTAAFIRFPSGSPVQIAIEP